MNDQREEGACDAPPGGPQAAATAAQSPDRKPFVEPSVSVPADVLEATALFQAPTVQTSVVP